MLDVKEAMQPSSTTSTLVQVSGPMINQYLQITIM